MKFKKFALSLVAASTLGLFVSGQAFADEILKIGVCGDNDEFWKPIQENLKKDGVELQLIKFASYPLPNRALNDGEIDLNAFQTGRFLQLEVQEHGYKIEPIGTTIIAPLCVYSQKIKSLQELKDGDKLSIPADPISTGRALRSLDKEGLITLKDNVGWFPTVSDIVKKNVDLELVFIDAANAASTLPDVAAGFINGAFAVDFGLIPGKDSIYTEDTEGWGLDNPFVNVIAARSTDKDNPLYQKVVELYHTKEVADIILNEYKGAFIPAFKY